MSINDTLIDKMQSTIEEYKKDKSKFKDYYQSMKDISKWLKEKEK